MGTATDIWVHLACPSAIIWGSVALATFTLWGWLVWRWWPQCSLTLPHAVEHSLTFVLHLVFMDLVPNWLTGLCLHRVPSFECWEHRWEHRLTMGGQLSSLFVITTLYAL